jgi:hypothetical protein
VCGKRQACQDASVIEDFLVNMAVNHNVQVEYADNGKPKYEAESPDEVPPPPHPRTPAPLVRRALARAHAQGARWAVARGYGCGGQVGAWAAGRAHLLDPRWLGCLAAWRGARWAGRRLQPL